VKKITDVKTERVERAIAADLAFLAAHPVRLSNRRRQSRSAGADRSGSVTGNDWPAMRGGSGGNSNRYLPPSPPVHRRRVFHWSILSRPAAALKLT
jgi:hypothetical protein